MRFFSWLLDNRLLVLLATGALLVAGAVAWTRLPIDAFPDVTNTQVMILSKAPGLAAVDVEPFLARARRAGRTWDLCVCDPPSFSTGGGAPAFDVQRDHRRLVESALAVLGRDGVLYFSTSHQRFEPALDGLPAARVEEITARTVPEDYRNRAVHRCWRIVRHGTNT